VKLPILSTLELYAYGAVVVLILALLAWGGIESHRVDVVKVERDTARSELAQARDSLKDANHTIDVQTASLKMWKDLATTVADLKQRADEMEAAAKAAEVRSNELLKKEATDNAKPDCAKLLAVDLAAVCPAHADGMQQRARGGVQGPPR